MNFHGLHIDQWCEDQMCMIRHDDCGLHVELDSVVVQAAAQNDRTGGLGKNPAMIGAECYEMLPVITLKMRKLPAIESLRHGRNMWGQPPSAVRRGEAPQGFDSRAANPVRKGNCINS